MISHYTCTSFHGYIHGYIYTGLHPWLHPWLNPCGYIQSHSAYVQ